jgi:hypothetical protein
MEQAVTAEGMEEVQHRIEGTLTKEQVEALQERERHLFGDGGDVRGELPRLRANVEQETYRRLLPGYVRRFIEKSAPLLDIGDVSTPGLARAVGLTERPGFDLLSMRPAGEERAIEVKGRAAIGDIELTKNEWAKACNLRERYWLYVVYECASPHPRLLRVQDPFANLLVRARGGVIIDEREILAAADAGT